MKNPFKGPGAFSSFRTPKPATLPTPPPLRGGASVGKMLGAAAGAAFFALEAGQYAERYGVGGAALIASAVQCIPGAYMSMQGVEMSYEAGRYNINNLEMGEAFYDPFRNAQAQQQKAIQNLSGHKASLGGVLGNEAQLYHR